MSSYLHRRWQSLPSVMGTSPCLHTTMLSSVLRCSVLRTARHFPGPTAAHSPRTRASQLGPRVRATGSFQASTNLSTPLCPPSKAPPQEEPPSCLSHRRSLATTSCRERASTPRHAGTLSPGRALPGAHQAVFPNTAARPHEDARSLQRRPSGTNPTHFPFSPSCKLGLQMNPWVFRTQLFSLSFTHTPKPPRCEAFAYLWLVFVERRQD